MILSAKGNPSNIDSVIVGRVTRDISSEDPCTLLIVDGTYRSLHPEHFIGMITQADEIPGCENVPRLTNTNSTGHLHEGDIVSVDPRGNLKTLYRVNSRHNVLFVTERCNSNCLMCSQPPRDRDDIDDLFQINQQLISLIPKDCPEICITGGEPTLMGQLFFAMLQHLKKQLPDTELHLLSNGRSFAWPTMAANFAALDYKKMMIGIPLYADHYQLHDFVVQAKDAFYQTVTGIHNLAAYGQRIEIRVVLHKQSIPRLASLAKYIYMNMPFVEHVAFMGLEYTGYTPHNIDKLWIDPFDYQDELSEAVNFLAGKNIHVSIYNSQLCLLPQDLWKFARRSISDWKNSYLPECAGCSRSDTCGGFFTWNLKRYSEHITPIQPITI